ncbi:helix-turn-helix domain-containing protein [Photobacterium damselae]|uniref:helix-turn-helix domain-containing protein n=1 Tax=Photobacterium damselae TaxID=38293 RepID=UPI003C6E97F6|nr:helix-turn-helix transcriptional regulator [Photobacterium damselae]
MFSNILKQYRDETGLTQQELVDNLNAYHSCFTKLDVVTLSRWENGKTLPPLKKQFIVYDYMKKLPYIINNISYLNSYIEKSENNLFEIYKKNKIGNISSIAKLIIYRNNSDIEINFNTNKVDTINFINEYNDNIFIENKTLINKLESISWIIENDILGTLFHCNHNDSLVIFFMYAQTDCIYEYIYRYLYTKILESQLDYIIFYVFDDDIYQLMKKIGGETIKSTRLSKCMVRRLIKFERIDLLSNKESLGYYHYILEKIDQT